MLIKKIEPFSLGKIIAVISAIMGLILSLLLTGIYFYFWQSAEMTMIILFSIIFMTILKGAAGFLLGVVLAIIYNILTSLLGGLTLKIETEEEK